LDAIMTAASCVLSPSSARKINPNAVMKVFIFHAP
jgi:hypothetical protein